MQAATATAVTTLTDPRGPRHARRVAEIPEVLEAGFAVGKWIVEREIGRGGMSTVYAVHHRDFGKRAALKLANSDVFGPRFTADRFLLEARVVNTVDHPDVIDVFDAGVVGDRPYLVMERLTGETLGDRLERGPMELQEITEILLSVCEILASAHAAGVVHRDIKLDNVYLARDHGRIRVVLLDWGLATIAGEDPLSDMIAGTPHYVAPEQVRGEQVTPRSDIYSLGVLAYVLYLGIAPFDADSSGEILDLQVKELPPPPKARWADIPPTLERLILKMLEKRPEDRPTISDVTRALRSLRRPSPPPPPPRRTPAPLADIIAISPSMVVHPTTPEPRWWLGALVVGALVAGGLIWRLSGGERNEAHAAVLPPPPTATITSAAPEQTPAPTPAPVLASECPLR